MSNNINPQALSAAQQQQLLNYQNQQAQQRDFY
jgi:hypothetical protein